MSKYDPLHKWLANVPVHIGEETLSFDQIEMLLGFTLPDSAKHHRAWWANPSSDGYHPYAQSWLMAGWQVDTVEQSQQWVRFRRRKKAVPSKVGDND
jgi:hypothetical protein